MGKALVATLGAGRGTWGHVARLISTEEWDSVLLVSNEWAKEKFAPAKEVDWILLNNRAGFDIIKDTIKEKLPKGEIAISMASGAGKEHMALIAALNETKRTYTIVTLTKNGIKYY